MRLALVCTLSDTPDTPMITTDIVDWCIEYVTFFLHQTLAALRTRVADSATERTRNQVLAIIRAAGARGITKRDLDRDKAFYGIPTRDRQDAIQSLVNAELIAWATIDGSPLGGRPRLAWVALNDATENDGAASGPVLVSESTLDRSADAA